MDEAMRGERERAFERAARTRLRAEQEEATMKGQVKALEKQLAEAYLEKQVAEDMLRKNNQIALREQGRAQNSDAV